MNRRITVVSGGLGVPSSTRLLADQLTAAVVDRLGPGTEIEVVELREHARALADNAVTGFRRRCVRRSTRRSGPTV